MVCPAFPRLTRPLRLHPAESSRVRVRAFPLLSSATMPRFRCCQNPSPPNKSFKPTPHRGVNSVLYATLARCRRPAVGRLNSRVRRQKGVWWLCFSMLLFPALVRVALRLTSRCVASSVKFVCRAHTSHTLRWPASETVIGVVSFSAIDTVASETSDWRFSSARSGLPASAFGKCAKVSLSRLPSRLTSRSSRPHIVASTACFALRCTLLPPRCGSA